MDRIPDEAAMRVVFQQWVAEDARLLTPAGRWGVELRAGGQLIGGATLLLLPPDDEFEIGWQLRPDAWGPTDRAGAARHASIPRICGRGRMGACLVWFPVMIATPQAPPTCSPPRPP